MLLSLLILSLSWHHVLRPALADDVSLTRRADGDVFTIPGSCNEACMVLSDDTASPFGSPSETISNSCTCQCNNGMPVYREDLRICVENIQECNAAGFVSSSGLFERVPYVFLPQYGQIIYPQAEIKFEGAEYPVCVITGVQQLGRSGWSELRNISDVVFPLSLYRDEERTFLQWTGDAKLRETAEGKIVVVKLACRDPYPTTAYRKVFMSCVAFRVAGSPSKSSIKEVSFVQSGNSPQGLTSAEYTAIGLSSVLLALIYMASVYLYLHVRQSRRKGSGHDELEAGPKQQPPPPPRHVEAEQAGIVKCNPLLQVSRHFESDSNSVTSDDDMADKLLQSESESDVENVNITSAVIHPHEDFSEPQEQSCNTGTIVGERLPEEDVRVVETMDNGNHHHVPVFPGTQRRKLYFNPAYFERQLLLAPPPEATEFLHKIREVISIAKHKMAAKRFVPTLNEIAEETASERPSSAGVRKSKKRASPVQKVSAPQHPPPPPPQRQSSTRRSLRCGGCPGCSHGSSTPNLPAAAAAAQISGESRVRAWLEDVKLLDARWRSLDDEQRPGPGRGRHLGGTKSRDADTESTRLSIKSMPPLLREQISQPRLLSINGCVNESYVDDKSFEVPCRRAARSVTHEPGYLERLADGDEHWSRRKVSEQHAEIAANAEVRRAIENSFKRQLEQLRAAEDKAGCRVEAASRRQSTSTEDAPKQQVLQQSSNKAIGSQKKENDSESRVLLNVINNDFSVRSSSDAKRIMDAVIKELVVAKEKESGTKSSAYDTDSLDRSKVSRHLSSSPDSTSKSSPAQSSASALPLAEELTMRNEIIDVQISETLSTKNCTIVKKHNLPEIVPLRPDNYALVSEVYVNDGYASPNGSDDDSGPEIQYEPENPGHLTIKVVDSPTNYEKQDESEYEPDTLDRKPMKLKINGDIPYEKNVVDEVFADSLERSSQILLRSKRSFREENENENSAKPPREYNSLREIYEARLKYQQQQQQQEQNTKNQQPPQQQEKPKEKAKCTREIKSNGTDTWYTKNYKSVNSALPPIPRHERRQRKADNQPDVVPNPPPPPSDAEPVEQFAKNAQDRSPAEADDPTTCEDAPVAKEPYAHVVGKPPAISRKPHFAGGLNGSTRIVVSQDTLSSSINGPEESGTSDFAHLRTLDAAELINLEDERRSEKRQQYQRFTTRRSSTSSERGRRQQSQDKRDRSRSRSRRGSGDSSVKQQQTLEDSAYVSSPDSGSSRHQLLPLDCAQGPGGCSCTESDESSSSGHGANSESGGESVETDSVFFACQRQSREHHRPLEYQHFQIEPGVY